MTHHTVFNFIAFITLQRIFARDRPCEADKPEHGSSPHWWAHRERYRLLLWSLLCSLSCCITRADYFLLLIVTSYQRLLFIIHYNTLFQFFIPSYSVSNIGWTLVADVMCRPSWDKPLEVRNNNNDNMCVRCKV